MSKTPSILVDTGFEIDQNGVLTEIIFPGVVTTLNAPSKITFEGDTLNYIPTTTAALTEFSAPNATAFGGYNFDGWTALTTIRLNNCETLNVTVRNGKGFINNCANLTSIIAPKLKYIVGSELTNSTKGFSGATSLTTLDFPELIEITDTMAHTCGLWHSNTQLVTINAPKLTTITQDYAGSGGSGVFNGCTSIVTLNLPSITNIISNGTNTRAFGYCTGLQNVTLGSPGHPVSAINSGTFGGCTQSGLTITIYTADGNALTGSPFGATNATIVYGEA